MAGTGTECFPPPPGPFSLELLTCKVFASFLSVDPQLLNCREMAFRPMFTQDGGGEVLGFLPRRPLFA